MQNRLTTQTLNLIARIPYKDLTNFGTLVAEEIKKRYQQHEIKAAKQFKIGDEVQFKYANQYFSGTIIEKISDGNVVVFRIRSDDMRKFVVPPSILKKQKVIK